ncbi:MAG: GTP-binding protein EngB [Candidatus Hadarchaeales archaeon]
MKEIVLVGRPNVGKSSLIRALTGIKVRIGKRPGVTRKVHRYRLDGLEIVDMPGFGFMAGVSREYQEKVKTDIVRYLENNAGKILFAILVIDAKSFLDITERWERKKQLPFDIEMFHFLEELKLHPILAVNKFDMIYTDERDILLDKICEKFGLLPPWRQWLDIIAPISAKTGEGIDDLLKIIGKRLKRKGKEKFLFYFKKFR